jgi:hypothetical protein
MQVYESKSIHNIPYLLLPFGHADALEAGDDAIDGAIDLLDHARIQWRRSGQPHKRSRATKFENARRRRMKRSDLYRSTMQHDFI